MGKPGDAPAPSRQKPAPTGTDSLQFLEKHKHIQARGLIASTALGLSDGLITNLAFLTGFAGAVSNVDLIRFAGIASMLAGSVSMLFGGILSARSEYDLFKADSNREAYEIEHEPDEERWELKNIYMQKGLSAEEAASVVDKVTSDKRTWLEDMLTNELHLHRSNLENPVKVGVAIGLSFLLGAAVPLIPYFIFGARSTSVVTSVGLSLAFLFAAGYWKGLVVKRRAWKSGLETLGIGATASGILYLLGTLFVFV
ncbi:MAG: VIT1/CCC1 transporter family protein [Thaumarchaeota archaeon]|nr:VIT1/CCC1 transporter family protein [Nitrososphaerota archaeon]